jgi:hypothetical protein
MIFKRGKSYGVKVYVGGRQKWVGTFKTRRDARDAEREALRRPVSPREETCDSFATRWVVDYPRPAAATRRTHKYALRTFIRDFAAVPLSEVDVLPRGLGRSGNRRGTSTWCARCSATRSAMD